MTKEIIYLPEGRLINEHLFEKNAYDENTKAVYSLEIAIEPSALDSMGDTTITDILIDALAEKYGDSVEQEYEDGVIGLEPPLLDGDRLAANRSAMDKPGDVYKGMTVIRAKTDFNFDGNNAAGGVDVFNEDYKEVTRR